MKYVLLFIIFISHLNVKSQNYLPGKITFLNGVQDSGRIEKKSWLTNPKRIKFQDKLGNEKFFTSSDLESFEVGSYRYKRAVVKIDQYSIDIFDKFSGKDTTIIDTVFLKVLVSGIPLNLYQYVDFKSHYYISTDSSGIEELIYRINNYTYHDQIQKIKSIVWTENLTNMVRNMNYNEKEITRFVRNANTYTKYNEDASLKFKERFSFFAGGGIAYQTLKFESSPAFNYRRLNFSNSTAPIISAGLDFFFLKNETHLAFRMQLSYYSFKTTGEFSIPSQRLDGKYIIHQNNLIPSFGLSYNIVHSPDFKLYAAGNVAICISNYKENSFILKDSQTGVTNLSTPVIFSEKWIAFPIQLGCMFNKHFDVRLSFLAAGTFLESPAVSESGLKSSFQLLYRF